MVVITIIVAVLLSVFSTAIMSYIAMAVPIGPWIEATLVLLATIIFKIILHKVVKDADRSIALAVAAGGIGGIAATACAFSFPTLYFLDAKLFNSWMAQPSYFCLLMGGLVLAAGGLGMLSAEVLEQSLVIDQKLPFAVGAMVHKMIKSQNQLGRALELIFGFVTSFTISILQQPILGMRTLIPSTLTVLEKATWYLRLPFKTGLTVPFGVPNVILRFDVLPMLIAVGYITGHVIALPLACGMLSKVFIVNPLNALFFSAIRSLDFELAFVSGMVLQGAVTSFFDLPKFFKKLSGSFRTYNLNQGVLKHLRERLHLGLVGATSLIIILFLTHFKFSPLAQLYIIMGTLMWTYEMCIFAGRFGIAPLGRFGTFLMVPGIILFGANMVHATIMASFVEICGGVAADALFGRTVAHLASIPRITMCFYQWLGLIIASLTIGIVFWLLISHFGLGTAQLFCQKAQARAMLLSVGSFSYYVLILGGLFGYLLKKISINPSLALGGILMPFDYSLGLVLGGLLTYIFKDTERLIPFWSGVFAANSIWNILKTIF